MTTEIFRDVDAARRRAERIRLKARSITEQYADLRALVDEAERNEDHLTLGYPSWTAYVADLFGDEPLRLPRDARFPMVQMLAEKGMSTRAIAGVVGVHHDTVAEDIKKAPVGFPTPAAEHIDQRTGEVLREADYPNLTGDNFRRNVVSVSDVPPVPGAVTGLDGKTYTRPDPKPAAPRRRAWTEAADEAGAKLDALVVTIKNLARDERFEKYKGEAPRFRKSLAEAVDALQRVHDQITTEGI